MAGSHYDRLLRRPIREDLAAATDYQGRLTTLRDYVHTGVDREAHLVFEWRVNSIIADKYRTREKIGVVGSKMHVRCNRIAHWQVANWLSVISRRVLSGPGWASTRGSSNRY